MYILAVFVCVSVVSLLTPPGYFTPLQVAIFAFFFLAVVELIALCCTCLYCDSRISFRRGKRLLTIRIGYTNGEEINRIV